MMSWRKLSINLRNFSIGSTQSASIFVYSSAFLFYTHLKITGRFSNELKSMGQPFVSGIRIHPIKSLDPLQVTGAEIGIRSLRYDREFAILEESGRFVNGKLTGRVNELKAEYDLPNQRVSLSLRGESDGFEFELKEKNLALDKFLSDFFNAKVTLIQGTHGELMDIPGTSSATMVSEASLKSLENNSKNNTLDDLRLRFRANLEIAGVSAFWEEQLFGLPGTGIRFMVGNVEMIGVSPRARCNVPPRNPFTGELDKSFVKRMIQYRLKSLPCNSQLRGYGSLYFLALNIYIPETEKGKVVSVGDLIKIVGPVNLDQTAR
jgi:uncharacterized protein YcbX